MKVEGFEDLIVLHVPDASSIVMQHALRHGISRFMRESQIFTDVVCTKTQCGVPEYQIDLPECRQLVSIEGVAVGEDDFCGEDAHTHMHAHAHPFNGWGWHRDSMYPILVLQHPPTKDDVRIRVKYSWAAKRDDCDVPAELYEQWAEAVKSAALAELFLMPKQEWTSPPLARAHEDIYQVELTKAKNRRWHNYSRRPLTIVSRPFLMPRR